MNVTLLKKLHAEYQEKFEQILKEYGVKDGFLLKDELWWTYYKKYIEGILSKVENDTLTIEDASNFYKEFGFGPKLYGNSFIENGIDKIKQLFLYLADDSIPVERKIRELVEESDNEQYVKGVGINFITLFLTTYYPHKYAQWNSQIDGALKILGLYPFRKRGEKKSEFYLKINQVCLEIQKTLGEQSLPVIDNFLYCINRGYIGNQRDIEQKYEKETKKIEKESDNVESAKETTIHTEMMYYLIKIGLYKKYDVWVATDAKNKEFKGERFSELCFQEIPNFTQPSTLVIAKYIDVIWFKKNTSHPVRFFEIEHSTSIYSGLLRLNDVKIDYPINKATIVIPKERQGLFETQIERRTFKHSELFDICDYLTYEDIKRWYHAVSIDAEFA